MRKNHPGWVWSMNSDRPGWVWSMKQKPPRLGLVDGQ
jgi:hypothetical protein